MACCSLTVNFGDAAVPPRVRKNHFKKEPDYVNSRNFTACPRFTVNFTSLAPRQVLPRTTLPPNKGHPQFVYSSKPLSTKVPKTATCSFHPDAKTPREPRTVFALPSMGAIIRRPLSLALALDRRGQVEGQYALLLWSWRGRLLKQDILAGQGVLSCAGARSYAWPAEKHNG